jgi:hypothetical protein
MKNVLEILRTELLGKKIKSYERKGGYSDTIMTITIDRIMELRGGYIYCEVTIHDNGSDKNEMYSAFDLENWEYEIC